MTISVPALAVYSLAVWGFPSDTSGLSDLNLFTGSELTEREVYVLHHGVEDTQSELRFEASAADLPRWVLYWDPETGDAYLEMFET